jgi:solute carrier family 25 citrate transporter 1
MARNEGLTSFFRGSWLRIIRIAPGRNFFLLSVILFYQIFIIQFLYILFITQGGAIQFAAYEQIVSWLNKRTN